MMGRQSLLGLAILCLLVAASVWLLDGPGVTATGGGAEKGPTWYFNEARLRATGSSGEVLYEVASPRIEHDPADDSAIIQEPAVAWLEGSAPPLNIDALWGRASARGARLRLDQEVRIVDETSGSRLVFRTDWLEVDAVSRLASTAAEVTVSSAAGTLTGRGLLADLNSGTIRIESAVRARYVR
jgi:lipopolysaccharide export system protein LptC